MAGRFARAFLPGRFYQRVLWQGVFAGNLEN